MHTNMRLATFIGTAILALLFSPSAEAHSTCTSGASQLCTTADGQPGSQYCYDATEFDTELKMYLHRGYHWGDCKAFPPIEIAVKALNFRGSPEKTLSSGTQSFFTAQRPFQVGATASAANGVHEARISVKAVARCEGDPGSNGVYPVTEVPYEDSEVSYGSATTTTLGVTFELNPMAYTCGGYPLARVDFTVTGTGVSSDGRTKTSTASLRFVQTLRVITYNIQYGNSGSSSAGTLRYDLDLTANHIRSQQADIINLVEVDQHWDERSNYDDQAARLGQMLGMPYIYDHEAREGKPWYCFSGGWSRACDYENRYAGLEILTSFPYRDRGFPVYHPFDNYTYGLQHFELDVGGIPMRVGNTHLAPNSVAEHHGMVGEEERLLQATKLLEFIGIPSAFTLVAGDFNAHVGTPEMQKLVTGGFREVCTLPGVPCLNGGSSPVDHIFVYNLDAPVSSRFSVMSANTVHADGLEPSDHPMKVVRLKVTPYW